MHRNRSKSRFHQKPKGDHPKHGRSTSTRGVRFAVADGGFLPSGKQVAVVLVISAGIMVQNATLEVFGKLYLVAYADRDIAVNNVEKLNKGHPVDLTDRMLEIEVKVIP